MYCIVLYCTWWKFCNCNFLFAIILPSPSPPPIPLSPTPPPPYRGSTCKPSTTARTCLRDDTRAGKSLGCSSYGEWRKTKNNKNTIINNIIINLFLIGRKLTFEYDQMRLTITTYNNTVILLHIATDNTGPSLFYHRMSLRSGTELYACQLWKKAEGTSGARWSGNLWMDYHPITQG